MGTYLVNPDVHNMKAGMLLYISDIKRILNIMNNDQTPSVLQ